MIVVGVLYLFFLLGGRDGGGCGIGGTVVEMVWY